MIDPSRECRPDETWEIGLMASPMKLNYPTLGANQVPNVADPHEPS